MEPATAHYAHEQRVAYEDNGKSEREDQKQVTTGSGFDDKQTAMSTLGIIYVAKDGSRV